MNDPVNHEDSEEKPVIKPARMSRGNSHINRGKYYYKQILRKLFF